MDDARRPIVWLLRDPQPDDPYEAALRDAGFLPYSLPVLEFEDVNTASLLDELTHPERYGGLISTSPRSSERIARSMLELDEHSADLWKARPAFTVGQRTAAILNRVGFVPMGMASGRGAELVRFIGDNYHSRLPLLFPAGDRRREDVPRGLARAGIEVEELVVYRTRVGTVDAPPQRPSWIVLFSPSGVEGLTESGLELSGCRLAAIGPTTAAELQERGLTADAVADQPEPAALCAAIVTAEERS